MRDTDAFVMSYPKSENYSLLTYFSRSSAESLDLRIGARTKGLKNHTTPVSLSLLDNRNNRTVSQSY